MTSIALPRRLHTPTPTHVHAGSSCCGWMHDPAYGYVPVRLADEDGNFTTIGTEVGIS